METIEKELCKFQEEMEKSLKSLKEILLKFKVGAATTSINLIDMVKVFYNGELTSLTNVANVTIINITTLCVHPWEKKMLSSIYRAILKTNLGFTPINNGKVILIYLPPLTEERRKDLLKKIKEEIEKGKISIRNIRKEANNNFKKNIAVNRDLTKIFIVKLQNLTNIYINKIDEIFKIKEKEIINF